MIHRARTALLVGVIGTATALAGAATIAAAQAAQPPVNAAAQQASAGDRPPSAVEDFAYPNAAKLLKEKGIKLVRGDGHIVLSECVDANILVRTTSTSADNFKYCFKATGKKGFLTLEVPEVFSVDSKGPAFQATVTSEGKKKTVHVNEGASKPVGTGDISPGSSGKPAVLVELRVNG
ncbi:hypothetical protein [Streptomyces natalensis]|uniref:hypothetical protein n=1 Tax=Streptomyces natalensis TaxID=68242 RepID=UPI000A5B495F|nr:hypothetical protein [Streptomyces natalensis]